MGFDLSDTTGIIHSFETLGAADGPGLRFVLFMQGCNLRCKYCHNPDSWKTRGAGTKVSAGEIADEITKYKNYFGVKGGVTVSGGEPLLQLDFLIALFGILKSRGINTAIDTSGAEFDESDPRYDELMTFTDLVILDIKHIDDEKCKKLTGRGNETTKRFAAYLSDKGVPMWIRQVLVTGFTDDETDLIKTREWINSLKTVEKVEVLPYHTLGVSKYDKLGIDYPLKGVNPPAKEKIERAEEILIK